MSDEAAFLAALATAPNDNTARLVYADWLDEHDRPGGELLRTECELATLPLGDTQWHEVFAKLRKTCEGFPEGWCAAVSRHMGQAGLTASAQNAWARLEGWCQQHHPALLSVLNPGASAEEIETVERAIGQPLPADVRESLAIHNGANSGFLFGLELLSTGSVIANWQTWRDVEGYNEELREGAESFPELAVNLDYTNAGWIPLTKGGGANHIGVDLAPGLKGTVGQVIIFGRDEKRKCVLASGWAEFLADYATFLESEAVSDLDPDPDVWGDICRAALGRGHPHDRLREQRQDGRWPRRKQN
ncbi:MAG: SMI1/KNR4 family protein [Planctomycetes bacterium]|nr:SMI1/KNR4 family protein [Planctomycetota bacterium]